MTKTVVFDFDGVIHSYTSGWTGICNISDPPVPGIKEAIANIRASGYKVVVVSTRCMFFEGELEIKKYLDEHGIVVDAVMREKPPAMVYIDDRAIHFDGDASNLLDKIRTFQPWNKKGIEL